MQTLFLRTQPETETLWEALAHTSLPLVLYGTGDGADKILAVLDSKGIRVASIMVSDDFDRGQVFHGHTVRTLAAVEALYPEFILLVAFGSHRPDIHDRIVAYAARHPLYVPDVPVCGTTLFDADFVRLHRENLEQAYDLLADDASRRVFETVIDYKLTGSLSSLLATESPKDEVFSELISLGAHERYLDLGAYRGDTLAEFCTVTGGSYDSITAIEPDPYTFRQLTKGWGDRPGVRLLPYAVGAAPGTLYLPKRRGRGSTLHESSTSPNEVPIPTVSVDSLALPVTYLKMDLEGYEEEALLGARQTLHQQAPLLNLACYHRSEDLYRLPLLLHTLQPRYRLYLRRHPCIPCWDLNLYARPE